MYSENVPINWKGLERTSKGTEEMEEERPEGKGSFFYLRGVKPNKIRLCSVEGVLGFLFFLRLRTCPIYTQT